MKKICVVTSGRYDWGYLYWICKDIMASDKLELSIIAPYNHQESLSIDKTEWIREVEGIDDYGNVFNDCLTRFRVIKPDIVLLLGDRFEIHAAAVAATLLNIPICYLHGGESTKGAFDDVLRNSITQMSTYHFTANEEYAANVARMIELCTCRFGGCEYFINNDNDIKPNKLWNKVFNVGSPGLDWITRSKLKTKEELQGYPIDKPFILACFNPVTLELENTEEQIINFIKALRELDENVILIKPNCDPNNDVINDIIKIFAPEISNITVYDNIDHLTYLSLMQYAMCMVGNSSSGIIETPSFNLPVVNIGTRQEGRIRGKNVIDVGYSIEYILKGIEWARNYDRSKVVVNPYGDGNSSKRIVGILENLT